jgi:dTDP-4-amino-4,6-dideoxygalactose transaminase
MEIPVDIAKIVVESKKIKLPVIEDAAQAHGAIYQNQKIGSLADIACFSFYPSKNLGALGEGGAITTNDENLAHKISQLRDYGRSDKYKHDFVGYNLRLQGMQAGFLSVKLPHLDLWNEERRQWMELYKKELQDTSVQFQSISSDSKSVLSFRSHSSSRTGEIIDTKTSRRLKLVLGTLSDTLSSARSISE